MDTSKLLNWNEYIQLIIGLFAMVTPMVFVPIFLTLVAEKTTSEKNRIALISTVAFFVVLLVCIFFGQAILSVFAISIPAFRIAGGILFLLMGLDMIRPKEGDSSMESNTQKSVYSLGVVPLAIPVMAGPGAISATIIFSTMHDSIEHLILLSVVILVYSLGIYLSLRISLLTERFFGETVITISNRLMGILLVAISVEFIMGGLGSYLPTIIQ